MPNTSGELFVVSRIHPNPSTKPGVVYNDVEVIKHDVTISQLSEPAACVFRVSVKDRTWCLTFSTARNVLGFYYL